MQNVWGIVWTVCWCLMITSADIAASQGDAGCTDGPICNRTYTSCSVNVTVDSQLGMNCSELVSVEGWSLALQVCNSLQDVFNIISSSDINITDCIEVYIRAGDYVLTGPIEITTNVIIRGEYNGRSSFHVEEGEAISDICSGLSTTEPPPPTMTSSPPTMTSSSPLSGMPRKRQQQSSEVCGDIPYADDFDVRVTVAGDVSDSQIPYYVLSFLNSDQVEMSGILFTNSTGIFAFENVSFVSLKNCSFSYFTQGAVDIYNCPTVSVSGCIFAYNGPADIVKYVPYRGQSSGLSLGFNRDNTSTLSPIATISDSLFFNNTIESSIPSHLTTTLGLQNTFVAQGGGLVVIVYGFIPVSVTITDCTIERNYASSFGGGMVGFLDGDSSHAIIFNRTRFLRNVAPRSAGGLVLSFPVFEGLHHMNRFELYNSEFTRNEAQIGGGVFLFSITSNQGIKQGNSARFQNCLFQDNRASEVGAAFEVIYTDLFQSREDVKPVEIIDCTFMGNKAIPGGVLITNFAPLGFHGNNIFENNRGPAVVVTGAVVEMYGNLTFIGNDDGGLEGGALFIHSLGQIRLHPGAGMTFLENEGALGSALVISTEIDVPAVFSRLIYNPLCALIFSEPTVSPLMWNQYGVSLNFTGNKAILSSAVLLNNADLCSWTKLSSPYFERDGVFRWDFVQFGENFNSAHESDEDPDGSDAMWYVQTPPVYFNITNDSVEAFAGESIQLGVDALDEFNQRTGAVFGFNSNGTGAEIFHFMPAAVVYDRLRESTITTTFLQLGNANRRQEDIVTAEGLTDPIVDSLEVASLRCPPGSNLQTVTSNPEFYRCSCNLDNDDIIACEGRRIFLEDGLWGTVDRELRDDRVWVYPCPYGYCRCFMMTASGETVCGPVVDTRRLSDQCDCDRMGILCGECRDGKGVSALLNKCVTCHNGYGTLILGLFVVDILVFLGLLVVMVPFPPWLYPCVFYLQMLPYLTEHFPVTFEKFRPYLYYVSSALGFYFPYDFCLYDNMDPLVSYTIRYIPFFTAVFFCPVVLVIRRYKYKPVPWHGLWWIYLLLYTPVVHTSMSILNCPVILDNMGEDVPRWYISGNVKCFADGEHAPLGLLAIFVLLYCVLLIVMAVVFSLEKLQNPRWLHHLVEPLTADFQDRCKWWGGVELGRRLLLLLFIMIFPGDDYPAIFILAIILAVFGFMQPYKRLSVNVLEAFLSSTVLVMLFLRNTQQVVDDFQVFPDEDSPPMMGGPQSRECSDLDDIEDVTPLTWLLSIFYYAPLAVTVVVVAIWIVFQLRIVYNSMKNCRSKKKVTLERNVSSVRIPQRPRTETVIELKDLDPTSPIMQPIDNPPDTRVRLPTSAVAIQDLEGSLSATPRHSSPTRAVAIQELEGSPSATPRHSSPTRVVAMQELEGSPSATPRHSSPTSAVAIQELEGSPSATPRHSSPKHREGNVFRWPQEGGKHTAQEDHEAKAVVTIETVL